MPDKDLLAKVESNAPVIPANPEDIINIAKEAAQALVKTVDETKTVVIVRGQKYLRFEHWQLLGTFAKGLYGGIVGAKAYEAEPVIDDSGLVGFKAKAVALLDGKEIGGALAYCFKSEKQWAGKPAFQIASMAQTRACSKALRNVLAWIVTLAGSGYQTMPAEEMEHENEDGPPSDLFMAFCDQIAETENAEALTEVGKEIAQAKKDGKITKAENDDLVARGKDRRKELKSP